ncbi:hypothetical protein [Thiosulfativibrio zosterae]|uniref:Uncharacterized protein n=1 Tax=Thiosulfativibrio zosterae TaxID=2675053 RepID=A0A6F8PMC3_9GAMM|nr:hypothetical protein [Thiosulfativibrio zosterae]BBP43252.1 hypothetical protein THMIRHAT_09980 [Thiosulfativibrio zosterae]
MRLNVAELVKQMIRWVYALSPYFWIDRYFKQQELAFEPESDAWQALRNKRLFLSEFYIVSWLVGSMLLVGLTVALNLTGDADSILNSAIVTAVVVLLLLRIFGIVNKEIGVILFGICKITEGTMVSATGRVIVLAMVNFMTALFLFATVYQLQGQFEDVPSFFGAPHSFAGLVHSVSLHFTMNGAFTPADAFTWLVSISQGIFCFAFGTIVISLFVSLLNVKPLRA